MLGWREEGQEGENEWRERRVRRNDEEARCGLVGPEKKERLMGMVFRRMND